MVRFLQQFETGQGDYTAERHTGLGKLTVRELGRGNRIGSALGDSQS